MQIYTLEKTKIAVFRPQKGVDRAFLAQNDVPISAGCTKFLPFRKNREFITIYVIKWYLLPQNSRFYSFFALFSLQNCQKAGQNVFVFCVAAAGNRGGASYPLVRRNAPILCLLCTKTTQLSLVDIANLCVYNRPSVEFDPIDEREERGVLLPPPSVACRRCR